MGILTVSNWNEESTCSKEIFPGGPGGKESTCNAGDPGVIPGWGRSLGEGNGCSSSILTWRIPCSEMLEGYRSWGRRESGLTELLTLSHSRWPERTMFYLVEGIKFMPKVLPFMYFENSHALDPPHSLLSWLLPKKCLFININMLFHFSSLANGQEWAI